MKIISKKQIPNILSFIRLLMVPVFAILFFEEFAHHRLFALIVFIAAGITDVIDGYLARHNNWITDFGKMLDPLADKMMQITAFVCLAIKSKVMIIIAAMICVKDMLMLIGGIVLAKKGAKNLIVSKWYGKLNTFVLAITISVMILYCENCTLSIIMAAISGCMMLFTIIMYFTRIFYKYIKDDGHGTVDGRTDK